MRSARRKIAPSDSVGAGTASGRSGPEADGSAGGLTGCGGTSEDTGESADAPVSTAPAGGLLNSLVVATIMCVMLMPYFAIKEIRHVFDGKSIRQMLFTPPGKSAAE